MVKVKVEGIVLAAGLSHRMQTNKMLLELNGKKLIEHCIDSMDNACSRIIVVGGHRAEEIRPVLSKYKKVELIFNQNYSDGMYSSVKAGLALVKGERFFLSPGDCPAIQPSVLESLLREAGEIVLPTYQGLKGHPVLMKGYLAEEIIKDVRYSNLREFIEAKGFKRVEVQCQGILLDVDTPEDFSLVSRYLARIQKN